METFYVTFTPHNWTPQSFSTILSESPEGILTTAHAQSSYGMPVIVDTTGQVYGPADILEGKVTVMLPRDAALPPLLLAAQAAGFTLDILREED